MNAGTLMASWPEHWSCVCVHVDSSSSPPLPSEYAQSKWNDSWPTESGQTMAICTHSNSFSIIILSFFALYFLVFLPKFYKHFSLKLIKDFIFTLFKFKISVRFLHVAKPFVLFACLFVQASHGHRAWCRAEN